MHRITLSNDEIQTILRAMENAERELCYNPSDPEQFPEAFLFAAKMGALEKRLKALTNGR